MREGGIICSSYYGIRETHLWGSPRFEYSVSGHVLKLNIQKTKASGPITSWKINGETMETVRDFLFLGSKITADGDCSHEIKRCLLLGRKAMTNQDSVLKIPWYHSVNKNPYSQSHGFSSSHAGMWELDHEESWVPKSWCFWTVVWRLLRVLWTARRSSQS